MLTNPNITKDISSVIANAVGGASTRPAAIVGAVVPTTQVQTIGTLSATPMMSTAGGLLDRVIFEVTTGGAAGSKGRVGIYDSISPSDITPDALVVDGGEFDTTLAQVNRAVVSVNLKPNTLYWLVSLFGTAAPTCRGAALSSCSGVIGLGSTMTTSRQVINASQTYGALPATWPGSSTFAATGTAIIWTRYV